MKEQSLPRRQTRLIEAIDDSIGESLYDDASLVDCSDREWCWFMGGSLVDADSGWNDPD